jgi:hypothetical protein
VTFEHHQPIDQVRARRGGEECRVRAHRLADQPDPLPGKNLFDNGDGVTDVRTA